MIEREKQVIIHKNTIDLWLGLLNPPFHHDVIQRVVDRINLVISQTPPEDLLFVEAPPSSGYTNLPYLVGLGNSARLYGARAGYCLAIAREVLERSGIPVSLDTEGVLP